MRELVNKGQVAEKRELKRLFFDIETSPNLVFSWNVGHECRIDYDNIVEERAIITICYKWEGNPKVYKLTWDKNKCDKQMLKDFIKVMHEADQIIGHNSIAFDTRWVRTRCLYHNILMMPEFTQLDTLKASRSNFRFNSNRLDYITKYLGIARKKDTGGFSLWKDCMAGSKKALDKMVKYCQNDVVILERVFKRLNPYIPSKIHVGVLQGKPKHSCPDCGSTHTQRRGTSITASGGKKQRYQCQKPSCGKYYSINIAN
jgi:DNA polymerase elongation subunit (family B)